jgi:hypothetical protein
MSITELYQNFIAGQNLPSISTSSARALLDLCRSKLLGVGRSLRQAATGTPDEVKRALLSAHRELQTAGLADGNGAVYNSAVTGTFTTELDEINRRAAKLKAEGNPSPFLNAVVEAQNARAAARPATATAPAPAAARPAPRSPQTTTPMSTTTSTTPTVDPAKLAKALLDEQERRQAASLVKTRAEFNLLKPAAAAKFFRDGGKLID